MLVLPDAFAADPDSYRLFAQTLRSDGVYGPAADAPSAFRPPLYPLLLTPAPGSRLHAAAVNLIAAGLSAWLTMSLAARLLSPRAALPAGLLFAIDPVSVQTATQVMTETVFTTLLLATLLVWTGSGRGRTGGTGLLLGLCGLTRPTAWAAWVFWLLGSTGRWRPWLIATGIGVLVCLPWVARNQRQFGRPILATTHGGYTLWLGQNPTFQREVVIGPHEVWPQDSFRRWTTANLRATADMDELRRDRHFRTQAVDWLTAHPLDGLRSMVLHVRRLWAIRPHRVPPVVAYGCAWFYAVLLGAMLVGLSHPLVRTRAGVLLPLTLAATTAVHALYWSNIRMRTPLMPLVAVLAVAGATLLSRGFRRTAEQAPSPSGRSRP